MKRNHTLQNLFICLTVCFLNGCGQSKGKEGQSETCSSVVQKSQCSDTLAVENGDERVFSWENIPADGEVVPLDFEKWLAMMNYIKDNHWSRPTAKMLADVGLEAMYETDDTDEDGIMDVHYIYGRQAKCVTDSAGTKYHTFDGDHSILFEVMAYTSSEAEIHFHNPADMKDFMRQAIERGVADCSNGRLVVCDKPMGKGIHKIRKVYAQSEEQQGEYAELYYLNAVYEPGEDWHTCYVTLDFLRHSLDIGK